MKGTEVKAGGIHGMKLHGYIAPVKVLYGIKKYGTHLKWIAVNLETGEAVRIGKRSRLRYEMTRDSDGKWRRLTK